MQPRAGRQRQQINPRRGDVLAEFAWLYRKTRGAELAEQFGMNQMHLTQIGLHRMLADARAVLDALAHMGIAGDTQPRQQANAQARRLAEVMAGAKADRDNAAHVQFHSAFAEHPLEDRIHVLEVVAEVELLGYLSVAEIIF